MIDGLSPDYRTPLVAGAAPPHRPGMMGMHSTVLAFTLRASEHIVVLGSVSVYPTIDFTFAA